MTGNYLLIYRLAELMLEHEQHILPVDLLFDDEQIGDFVKSIHIDSPYQQMLLEGVLTESVREEMLYVSYTVEGYFHFVLGEVIYNRTEGLGPEALKQIVEENKLIGAKEGVEQCLIRDVQKDDLARLIWLIDAGGKALKICSYPLAEAFLIHPIERILTELLADSTGNDVEALENTIEKLEDWHKNEEAKSIYMMLSKWILPNTFKNLSIIIDSIAYLEFEQGLKLLRALIDLSHEFENIEEQQLILQEIGIQFLIKEDFANAELYLTSSIELEQKINRKESNKKVIKGRSYSYLCSLWIDKKQYEKALNHYKKELNFLLKSEENQEENLYLVYNNLGYIYSEIYDTGSKKYHAERAIKNYEKSLSIRNKIFGKYHPSIATIYNNLGLFYLQIGDIDKAEIYLRSSFEIRLRIFSNKPPTDIAYNNLSKLYFKKGDIQSAIDFGEKALTIREKELGFYNSKTGTSFNNLAWYYYDLKKYNEALKYAKSAIRIRKKIFGPFDLDVAESYILLATIYTDFNNYKEAIKYESKALNIRLIKLGENNYKSGISYANIGYLQEKYGDVKKAIRNYNKALKIDLLLKGLENSETGSTFFTIANLYLGIKDYRKALDLFKKGFQSNKDSGCFPFGIGNCYENLNQMKDAIQYYCLSADLRRKSLGLENEATQSAIQKACRLAEESNNLKILPDWIKRIINDL